MPTVGERLRQAREQSGLALQDVADKTKIQLWILADIERDDLSRVPGGIFIRGYLTSFAEAVGLDGQRLWGDYRAETRVQTVESEPVPQVETPPASVSRLKIAGIAAALMAAVVIWRVMPRSLPDSSVAVRPSLPQRQVAEVVPTAAPTAGRDPETVAAVDSPDTTAATATQRAAPTALPTTASPLALRVHATSEVWLDAKADGEQRAYRLFAPGEDLSIDARTQILLRVGDASAVTYTINGLAGRPLGGPGVVRDMVVAPDTYRMLTAEN